MNRSSRIALPCPEEAHMLDEMQKTISMAELAKNAERIAKDIETAGTVYRVKRPGHRAMLLMDDAYFEGWKAVIELMQRANWRDEWARSEAELAQGRGRELSEVLAELTGDSAAKPHGRAPARRDAGRRAAKDQRRSPRTKRRTA
ncbi:MAG: hypothetical protein HOV81_09795 [Kofleriaceae bacterium]|nr:hypothetical protein [Kofleriaceae bacterium]